MRTHLGWHKRARWTAVGAGVLVVLASGVAVADTLVADGDGVGPVQNSTLDLGSVCPGDSVMGSVTLAITREGNYTNAQVFQKGSGVTVTVTSTSGGVGAATPVGTITLPNDWDTLANTTRSDTITSTVTLAVPTSATPTTAGSGGVAYLASGVDAGGNLLTRKGSLDVTWTVKNCTPTDTTAPKVTVTPDRVPDSGTWYNQPVTFTATSDDPTAICDVPVTYSQPDQAGATVTMSCTDPAKNKGSGTATFDFDGTAPTISASATTSDGQPYTGGWTNKTVTVQFTCGDATSGIAVGACPADVVVDSDTAKAGTSVSRAVKDNAGNTSAATTPIVVQVDKTKPTLNPSVTPNPVLLNGSATATPNAADPLSGIATQSCNPVVTSAAGAQSVSCSATDNAGNSASANAPYSVIYKVDGGGILPPINPDGSSVFKLGSTVPVKFRLLDANNQPVGTPGLVTSFKLTAKTTVGPAITVNEDTVSTAAYDAFRYDPTSGQWIYNLATKGLTSGVKYTYTITLDSGQTIVFSFALK